jgi:uncharacterized membrane protein YobD (UPF0266 family)
VGDKEELSVSLCVFRAPLPITLVIGIFFKIIFDKHKIIHTFTHQNENQILMAKQTEPKKKLLNGKRKKDEKEKTVLKD